MSRAHILATLQSHKTKKLGANLGYFQVAVTQTTVQTLPELLSRVTLIVLKAQIIELIIHRRENARVLQNFPSKFCRFDAKALKRRYRQDQAISFDVKKNVAKL